MMTPEQIREWGRRQAASAPPMSPELRARVRAILRGANIEPTAAIVVKTTTAPVMTAGAAGPEGRAVDDADVQPKRTTAA